jgi:hypothetical protein
MKNSPAFWRWTGWVMLVSDLAFLGFAGFQSNANPAAVLVVILGMPFLLIAGVLVISNRACEWMAKPPLHR